MTTVGSGSLRRVSVLVIAREHFCHVQVIPVWFVFDYQTRISLVGFGTVYIGLESAAKSLAKSLADETVSVVQHK